jgi:hypothetical protein
LAQLPTVANVDVPAGMRRRMGDNLHALKAELLHVRRCPASGALGEKINDGAGLRKQRGAASGTFGAVRPSERWRNAST